MPERIGRYRVLKVLGEGHFGAVYLGEGEVPGKGPRAARNRLVAIKQLRGEWTMGGFETLVREFELLDRVKHRSLCRVYEFLDRECAVVMEYVEGSTLRDVLDAFGESGDAIWADAAMEIGCEIADCLYQAHATPGANGDALLLVHRDVKPENVMLTPTGEVKLLDFGLARIDDGVREVGVKGTPLYMAPEQARGDRVEHRTDLFGLGLVVFELVTGRAAYPIPSKDRESVIEALMARIERADLADELRSLGREHPRIADEIARCIAVRPTDRPEDGHEVMLAFRRCVEHRGALAEFAAFTFGPLGPLATQGIARVDPSSAGLGTGPAKQGIPHRLPTPVKAVREADMMAVPSMPRAEPGEFSEVPEPTPMSKPESPRPPAAPRPSGGARPRPTPAARPAGRPPTPAKMWSPEDGSPAPPPKSAPSGQDLRMVPLSPDHDEEDRAPQSSSTTFFALPAPVRRKDPGAGEVAEIKRTEPAPAGPPPGAPPGGYVPVGAVPPGYAQGYAAPSYAPQASMAPIGIQGPIAGGYPGMPVAATLPPDLSHDVQRARSYRVFAVVAGLMFMVFSVTIVAVLLMVSVAVLPGKVASDDGSVVAPITSPPPRRPEVVDTGLRPAPIPKEAVPKAGPKAPPGPRPAPAPARPAPPPTTPGTVTVTLAAGSPPFTSFEVVCSGASFRQRAPFANGSGTLAGVPREDCKLYFKGGPPISTKVTGGQTLSCSFVGSAANCN